MEITGVRVPAGSIARSLGVESYDLWPAKPEVHERHFFQLELVYVSEMSKPMVIFKVGLYRNSVEFRFSN